MSNKSSEMENAMNTLTEAQKEKLNQILNRDIELQSQLSKDLYDAQALRDAQRQWRAEEVKDRQLERKLRRVHLGLAAAGLVAELALFASIVWFVIT